MRKTTLFVAFLTFLSVSFSEAKDINIKSLGAKGDGKTKATAVIQKAIDEVHKAGGGRVIVSGGSYLVTPFEIKSNVELFIDADATLLGSTNLEDYPDRPDPKHYITENMPRYRNVSLIYADEAENIAITGRGVIDGQGSYFVKPKTGDDWHGWHFERTVPRDKSMPRMIFFAGCKNVTVRDITVKDSPAAWSFMVHDCEVVHFDHCKVWSDLRYMNNDGIHLNCCRDVTISNCDIKVGDDAIAICANSRSLRENKSTERVVVTNCVLQAWSTGIRVGWTDQGIIANCSFSNIQMKDVSKGVAFQFPGPYKSTNNWGREYTLVENLTFSNIRMDHVYLPIYGIIEKGPDLVHMKALRNISFTDVTATGMQFPYFKGREDCMFEEISFNNCTFEKRPIEEFADYRRHGDVPVPEGERFVHVNNIRFNNTRFISK